VHWINVQAATAIHPEGEPFLLFITTVFIQEIYPKPPAFFLRGHNTKTKKGIAKPDNTRVFCQEIFENFHHTKVVVIL
jgi:hypothetical protein